MSGQRLGLERWPPCFFIIIWLLSLTFLCCWWRWMPNATLTFIPQDYCHLSGVRSKMKRIEGWLFSMSRKRADRKVGWVRVKSLSDGERQGEREDDLLVWSLWGVGKRTGSESWSDYLFLGRLSLKIHLRPEISKGLEGREIKAERSTITQAAIWVNTGR